MSEKIKSLIPFGTILITDTARQLINKALNSGRVSNGNLVREFEKKFAGLLGVNEAVALSSGTDADALALAVLYDYGAKRGDEIIIPALTFIATANAVLQAGFNPVFADIEKETLNINPDLIEKVITSKTKAIMPVHLMGKPAKMDKIAEIARKYDLKIIEDAAEAHGSMLNDKKIGTFGDMAAFSTYIAHMISTIEGGVIATNNKDYAEIIRSLRSHGRACKCEKCISNINSEYCPKRFDKQYDRDKRFIFERVGFSSKMNEIEAAVGLGTLEIFPEIMKKRRENLLYLCEQFRQFEDYFYTITEEKNEIIGPHAFPIILKKGLKFSRNEFVIYLEKNGIDSRDLFSSIPTQCKAYRFLGHKAGDFPDSEYVGNNGLHIGIHQDIGIKEIDQFIILIKQFLTGK